MAFFDIVQTLRAKAPYKDIAVILYNSITPAEFLGLGLTQLLDQIGWEKKTTPKDSGAGLSPAEKSARMTGEGGKTPAELGAGSSVAEAVARINAREDLAPEAKEEFVGALYAAVGQVNARLPAAVRDMYLDYVCELMATAASVRAANLIFVDFMNRTTSGESLGSGVAPQHILERMPTKARAPGPHTLADIAADLRAAAEPMYAVYESNLRESSGVGKPGTARCRMSASMAASPGSTSSASKSPLRRFVS